MDDISFQAMKEKIDFLTVRNMKLERQNRNMKKVLNKYRRIIRHLRLKLEGKKTNGKQYYRNGRKRGRTFNG